MFADMQAPLPVVAGMHMFSGCEHCSVGFDAVFNLEGRVVANLASLQQLCLTVSVEQTLLHLSHLC